MQNLLSMFCKYLYFRSMFCLKRIAQIFACRVVNIQIEFLAAKYLRNVLAGVWLMLYKVVSRFVSSILICYLQLLTNYHTRLSCPGSPAHNLYFRPLQHLIFAPLVILMSIVTPGVCLYCSDVSLLHCLPIPAASPWGVKGVMMALFTQQQLALRPAIISKIITNWKNILFNSPNRSAFYDLQRVQI